MDHIQIKSELIEQLIEISKEAGKAILEVYNTDFDHQIKEDLSPLTKADTLSNGAELAANSIDEGLAKKKLQQIVEITNRPSLGNV